MERQIAYRRVSTKHLGQDTARQLFNTGIIFDKEFEDKQSGSSAFKRTDFKAMLEYVREGDTISVQSNDRVFRNTREMLGFVEDMMDKGVTVKFHTERLEFKASGDPMQIAQSKLMLTNLASFSELFLTMNSISIKQGLEVAKSKGVRLGGSNLKWKESFESGKSKHISKTNHVKSQELWESKRSQIEGVLKVMKSNKISLTFKNISSTMNDMNIKTATGRGFSPSQAQRALDYLKISR
jgi:DNA invertase Pin-like site-specific DNA recombinase